MKFTLLRRGRIDDYLWHAVLGLWIRMKQQLVEEPLKHRAPLFSLHVGTADNELGVGGPRFCAAVMCDSLIVGTW